jgi:uncharacterized membrane protein
MKGQTVRKIALVTVMTAIVCVLTMVAHVPTPVPSGYNHLGDVGVNFAALAFGPWLGFLIGGGGTAIADLLLGAPAFAPGSLVVHGLQAVVVAFLGRGRKPWGMFLAALAGGLVVIAGYFLYEWPLYGLATAVSEIPSNILQVLIGLVGVPLYILVARAYPPLVRWTQGD